MTTRYALIIFPLLLAGMSLASLPAQVEGAATSQDFTHAVKASDYVVLGRVVGMVDRSVPPDELDRRKHLEAHRVDVLATLKGYDITQRRIVVRPNTLRWTDGDTYVLFLKDRGNGFFDAIPEVVLTESPADIAALVQRLGFGVLPRLQLRMRILGGCCSVHAGMLQDLRIAADGRFEYEKILTDEHGHLLPKADVFTGVLPKAEIGSLVTKVTTLKKAPMPDGGHLLTLEISSAPGKVEYSTFNLGVRPDAGAVVASADQLARENAKTSVRVDRDAEK
jgi:hypothetical protein